LQGDTTRATTDFEDFAEAYHDQSVLANLMILALILLIVAIVLVAVTVWWMAVFLLRPARMTDGRAAVVLKRLSPGDLGLRFESMRFIVRDQRDGKRVSLAAWWIPHEHADGKCVVLVHGYGDAKVGAIAWAPTWHALGYNILAIDLRAHGESGGKYTTAGFFERHDLDQVLNQIRAERPRDTTHLVLFGISLGAAVCLATAADREDIDALVLECPYSDYHVPVLAYSRIFAMPLPSLAPLSIRLGEWISGADFSAHRPIDMLKRVRQPTMVIQAGCDPFVPDSDAEGMEAILRDRAAREDLTCAYWRVGAVSHVMGIVDDPDEYRARIAEFLRRAALANPNSESRNPKQIQSSNVE
jgi:pimeloyl-ACP methyl ester carboxylesterase